MVIESTAPIVVREMEGEIKKTFAGEKFDEAASRKLSEKIEKRGFVEEQLLEGMSYIASKWDLFRPGPAVYPFFAINHTLWYTVWMPKYGSDEEIMKKRLIPVIRDRKFSPGMRLMYLQMLHDHIRDRKNSKQQVDPDFVEKTLAVAYELEKKEEEDEKLRAYSIEIIALRETSMEARENVLRRCLESPRPKIQDAAVEMVGYAQSSEALQDRVIDFLQTMDSLPEERQRNVLRNVARIVAKKELRSDKKLAITEKLTRVYEKTRDSRLKEHMGNTFSRIAQHLEGQDKEKYKDQLRHIRSRVDATSRRAIDASLERISTTEEFERKHGKQQ